jgi:heme A synthase
MWIEVHARGGEVAIVLAVLAALWALFRLRSHRDLVIGAIVLAVLLVVEAYIGGLIHDDGVDALTPVHLPLALLLMGLTVWLPLRASGGTRRSVRTGPAHHVDR